MNRHLVRKMATPCLALIVAACAIPHDEERSSEITATSKDYKKSALLTIPPTPWLFERHGEWRWSFSTGTGRKRTGSRPIETVGPRTEQCFSESGPSRITVSYCDMVTAEKARRTLEGGVIGKGYTFSILNKLFTRSTEKAALGGFLVRAINSYNRPLRGKKGALFFRKPEKTYRYQKNGVGNNIIFLRHDVTNRLLHLIDLAEYFKSRPDASSGQFSINQIHTRFLGPGDPFRVEILSSLEVDRWIADKTIISGSKITFGFFSEE